MLRAQTLDQFISRYKLTDLPDRIYYHTCSFQSADHFSGTYVLTKGSLFRRRSQSTCLDVEFLTDLKGKMKHKATEVRETCTRKSLKG